MRNLKKGFTLIELLVVVAIIAILISIVLFALDRARRQGSDAGVTTNLHTVANQAELFFLNNNNSYLPSGGISVAGVCPTVYNATGTNMFSQNKSMIDAITEAVSVGNGLTTSTCYNSADSYAVAVGETSAPHTSWCIDSTGAAKQESFDPSAAIDSSTFLCK
jgi:prepilin-type N-terminal cleavage/methylation domain-containing protein